MVSLLSRGVGVLVRSLAGLSSTQASRCSSLPSALAAVQCTTLRCFAKDIAPHDPSASYPKECPKRPLSSYFRFMREQRPVLAKKHPDVSVIKLAKIIGSEWRGLPPAEKQVYVDAARIDLLKYRENFQKYKESLNPLDLEILRDARRQKLQRRKTTRRKRELTLLGIPKRCRSSFSIFMSENFHEAKGDSVPAKLKHVVHEWNNLPSLKKQVYTQLAEDDKVRYQNEIKAWEEQMIEIGREDLIRHRQKPRRSIKNSEEAKIKDKEPGKKEKNKKASEPTKGRKRGPGKHEE